MDAGLSFDQAPPLSIPASFFLSAPLALVAAGAILCWRGAEVWLSPWVPSTLALTHVATLGVLTMIMWGALYQMLPVLAGAPVPVVRLAHGVHALLAGGMVAFAGGLLLGQLSWLWVAAWLLGAALLGFTIPVGIALHRTTAADASVQGMRLAFFAFVLATLLAVVLLILYAAGLAPPLRAERLLLHLSLIGVGWVGGLLVAVSWQIVPMFYLSPHYGGLEKRISLGGIAMSVGLLGIAFAAELDAGWVLGAALPGALVVFLLHPARTLLLLTRRRRKRVDDSIYFWRAGCVLAPAVLLLVVLAVGAGHGGNVALATRLAMAAVWVAIPGWAGLIMHGMLSRIVPFLVWFHRFAPLAGKVPIPTTKQLLPKRQVRWGLYLQGAAVGCGLVGILLAAPGPSQVLARGSGLLLMATGVNFFWWQLRVLRRRPAATTLPEVAAFG